MSIFSEVKEHMTARQVAESYGLQVRRNGLACCPFHDDRHPSMKIDRNYHCFACGAGGDAIDYVSHMFGLSQYEVALEPNSVIWFPRSRGCLWCGTGSLFSVPSPISNDGVLWRSEQSVGELLRNRLCRLQGGISLAEPSESALLLTHRVRSNKALLLTKVTKP